MPGGALMLLIPVLWCSSLAIAVGGLNAPSGLLVSFLQRKGSNSLRYVRSMQNFTCQAPLMSTALRLLRNLMDSPPSPYWKCSGFMRRKSGTKRLDVRIDGSLTWVAFAITSLFPLTFAVNSSFLLSPTRYLPLGNGSSGCDEKRWRYRSDEGRGCCCPPTLGSNLIVLLSP